MVSATPSPEGADEPEEVFDPDHRTYQHLSLRGPAMIVLGIAVFIVVAGIVASALDSGNAPTLSIRTVTIPDGTVVHLTPATVAMKSIVDAGEPPADILGNMAVPATAAITRSLNSDQNETQFDRSVYFRTGLSSDQVVDVYRTVLPRLGWTLIYDGAGAGHNASSTEVLAKKGSGDGFYWEAGVVVSPTTSAGSTPFSIELFELADDN